MPALVKRILSVSGLFTKVFRPARAAWLGNLRHIDRYTHTIYSSGKQAGHLTGPCPALVAVAAALEANATATVEGEQAKVTLLIAFAPTDSGEEAMVFAYACEPSACDAANAEFQSVMESVEFSGSTEGSV